MNAKILNSACKAPESVTDVLPTLARTSSVDRLSFGSPSVSLLFSFSKAFCFTVSAFLSTSPITSTSSASLRSELLITPLTFWELRQKVITAVKLVFLAFALTSSSSSTSSPVFSSGSSLPKMMFAYLSTFFQADAFVRKPPRFLQHRHRPHGRYRQARLFQKDRVRVRG